MASPLRTAFPTKEEYEKQVASYDAGRPNTAAIPKPAMANGTDRQTQGLSDAFSRGERAVAAAIGTGARKVMDAGAAFTDGKFLGQNPSTAQQPVRQPIAQPVAATAPVPTPSLTPDQQQLADVRSELGARNYRMSIDGVKAGEKSIANPLPTREQVGQIIREKNGLTDNTGPQTARPGTTLAATEVSPRKPLAYNGAFADGGPQAKAEAALARKQMEVLSAERGSKGLLYGPGSRDYISPMLSEGEQRARQNEIAEQRKKDVEDVAAQQIASQTTRMMNDQAMGLTSDRNLAMMPYAQRRAVINDRNNLTRLNADMQTKRMEEEGKAAGRKDAMAVSGMEDATKRRGQDMEVDVQRMKEGGETARAQMTDSTTRRGQDVELEKSNTNAEIAARSKALDREAMLEAARIRKNAPVDRVKIEGIKAYNKYIADRMTLNPELQNDPAFFESARKTFGLSSEDLKAQMMTGVIPDDDSEFYTP